jgi:hypothetical protein
MGVLTQDMRDILAKRDAGLRRNREKGWFTQPIS